MLAISDPKTARTKRDRWTTIVLREQLAEPWFATNSGLTIVGDRETAAAAAAADYRTVEDTGE